MALTAQFDKNSTPPVLVLTGTIDEDSRIKEIVVPASGPQLVLDLGGISHINSVGIRSWINWVKDISQGRKLIFRRCPRVIVMQMNMVGDFLPPGSTVESFYVPYYCETCDEESEVLFTVGKEIEVAGGTGVRINYDPKGSCKTPDCEIEIDTNEGRYFRFLSS